MPAASLIDALPCGVVVVRPDGEVISANRVARELLPDLEEGVVRCCYELFSCREEDGICSAGCLAVRAAEGAEPLPEFRVDVGSPGPVTAVWVIATPLLYEPGAILHLRAGDARDRRRRSDPHWVAGPMLRIRVLGRTRVASTEGELGGDWLRQRPGEVLKLLVCERHRVVSPDEIAEAIWPGSGRRALSNTRHFVHRLRSQLEPERSGHGRSSFVVGVAGGYSLNRERVWIDADEFEQAVKEGLAALERVDTEEAQARLEYALALYEGDFLADEPYADWAYEERDRLRALAVRTVRTLVVMARDSEDGQRATVYLSRLAELEPLDSAVHRELLSSLLAEGRRTEAVRRYSAFAARLRRDFDEEPEFDLRSLLPPAG